MSKEELEAAIKLANVWSGRSTIILGIGILGEYVLVPFLEKGRWKNPVKIVCAILVVGGIVGEYEFSSQIAQHAANLQRLSDHELADATTKAGEANERSKTLEVANKQLAIDLVNAQSALASKQAALGTDLEKARQETAHSQKQAADAQLALKLSVDTLTKNVNPRNLECKGFAKLLMGSPKGAVRIWYEPGDDEARTFASQVGFCLTAAGWSALTAYPQPVPNDPSPRSQLANLRAIAASTGLAIAGKSLADNSQTALVNALRLGLAGWFLDAEGWIINDQSLSDNQF